MSDWSFHIVEPTDIAFLRTKATRGSIPLRKIVYVRRQTGECMDTDPLEEWFKLSKLKRIRAYGPSRLAITIFGRLRGEDQEMMLVSREPQEVVDEWF